MVNIWSDSRIKLLKKLWEDGLSASITIPNGPNSIEHTLHKLMKKDNTKVIGIKSPKLVFMIMPIEPAYIEALKNNKDLLAKKMTLKQIAEANKLAHECVKKNYKDCG